jgi:hypothetical protein
MRRSVIAFILALVPAIASAGGLAVSLDQSVRLTLRTPAQDVIVGNPDIADVSVADPRHLVITGKKFGVTNLIVTNTAGRTIFNSQVVVSTPDRGRVSLYTGADMVSFACSPRCVKDGGAGGAGVGGYYGGSNGGGYSPPVAPAPGVGAVQASPNLP